MTEKETKAISPSKATAAKTMYEAFKILKAEAGVDSEPGSPTIPVMLTHPFFLE
jgi:hypothetical protein